MALAGRINPQTHENLPTFPNFDAYAALLAKTQLLSLSARMKKESLCQGGGVGGPFGSRSDPFGAGCELRLREGIHLR
jgi:hypothetical protein